MMKVALCGLGRAGKEVVRALKGYEDITVTSAFCRLNSEKIGRDIGTIADLPEMGATAEEISHMDSVFAANPPDVVIDFSNPVATRFLLTACKKHRVSAVVCTTGFDKEDVEWMRRCVEGEDFGVVYAPNITVGVNVLMSMLKAATRGLPYYDYQITEIHHNRKADIPSGTAKKIAALLENELHLEPNEHVPVNSVRAGGYVGVHEVMIAGEYDRITVVHESFSRRVFAEGAIRAAYYIASHAGWHSMEDVISHRRESFIRI